MADVFSTEDELRGPHFSVTNFDWSCSAVHQNKAVFTCLYLSLPIKHIKTNMTIPRSVEHISPTPKTGMLDTAARDSLQSERELRMKRLSKRYQVRLDRVRENERRVRVRAEQMCTFDPMRNALTACFFGQD